MSDYEFTYTFQPDLRSLFRFYFILYPSNIKIIVTNDTDVLIFFKPTTLIK